MKRIAELVGSVTAGTNGSIAEAITPSGCHVSFTTMRVSKRDGGRFHLIGVKPTIPVAKTMAGIIAGRDEVLERALTYVRTK